MSADNPAFDMNVKVSMNNDATAEIKTPDEEIDHPLQTVSRLRTGVIQNDVKWLVTFQVLVFIVQLMPSNKSEINQPSNLYVVKRNFIHQLMDVALLMANISQLKALLELGSKDKYYYLLLVTIVVSISLQVIFTICMLIIWSIEKGTVDNIPETLTEFTEKAGILKVSKVANALDKIGNVLVLCIIVANVFIVGFGVEPHGHVNSGANDTSA